MADDDAVNNEFRRAWQEQTESKMDGDSVLLTKCSSSFGIETMQVLRVE